MMLWDSTAFNNVVNIATTLACLITGVDPSTYNFHEAVVKTAEDRSHPSYGVMDRLVCKWAADMYREAHGEVTYEALLYDRLYKSAHWCPEFDVFTAPVYKAIVNETSDAQAKLREHADAVKAAGVADSALKLLGNAATAAPAAAKTMLTLGGGLGASTGALYWLLNRHANEDEDEIEANKQRLKHYQRITAEISQDLNRSGVQTPDSARNIIKQDSGANYVTG